jgi:hypothetical protein
MVDSTTWSIGANALLLEDAMQFGWKMKFHLTQGYGTDENFPKNLGLDPKHLEVLAMELCH